MASGLPAENHHKTHHEDDQKTNLKTKENYSFKTKLHVINCNPVGRRTLLQSLVLNGGVPTHQREALLFHRPEVLSRALEVRMMKRELKKEGNSKGC